MAGVQPEGVPALRFLKANDASSPLKFKVENDATVDSLKELLESIEQDKATPYKMSEPIPTEDDGEALKTIVGLNWEDEVIKNDQDVFVMFYA
jgi:hypothetical protein